MMIGFAFCKERRLSWHSILELLAQFYCLIPSAGGSVIEQLYVASAGLLVADFVHFLALIMLFGFLTVSFVFRCIVLGWK